MRQVLAVLLLCPFWASCHHETPNHIHVGDPTYVCDTFDGDGDGQAGILCGGDDCDDEDPAVHPGADERCNFGDDDCDGIVDEGCACEPGQMRPCPPPGSQQGACRAGYQRCDGSGTYGACQDAVLPVAETCNGLDDDCDGQVDEGLTGACGGCVPPGPEICGNGLDDDCNGVIDDPATCNQSCKDAEPGAPAFACCADDSCPDLDCGDRMLQPCYSGAWPTLGVGICHGGLHDCAPGPDGSRSWTTCAGEVLPGAEICGNGLDDDCDGRVDEADGTGLPCAPVPCVPTSSKEICGNGLDDDCDGFPDDGCVAGGTETCFSAPVALAGTGGCTAGSQQAEGDGGWGPCLGAGTPKAPACGGPADADCDGRPDPLLVCGGQGLETCNGQDDDGDGLVDEGVRNACGTCGDPCGELQVASPGDCVLPGRTCDQVLPDAYTESVALDRRRLESGLRIHLLGADGTLSRIDIDGDGAHLKFQLDSGFLGQVRSGPDGDAWLIQLGACREPTCVVAEHVTPAGKVGCVAEASVTVMGPAAAKPDGTIRIVGCPDLRCAEGLQVFDFSSDPMLSDPTGKPWADGRPRCAPLTPTTSWPPAPAVILDGAGALPQAAALDVDGSLWISAGVTIRIDPDGTATRFPEDPLDCLVAAAGRMWTSSPLRSFAADGSLEAATGFGEGGPLPPAGCPAPTGDGRLLVGYQPSDAGLGRGVTFWDPATSQREDHPLPEGLDRDGVVQQVLDTAAGPILLPGFDSPFLLDLQTVTGSFLPGVGTAPTGDSDTTLLALAHEEGRFTVDLDASWPDAYGHTLRFEFRHGPLSLAQVVVRQAPQPALLGAALPCGPFTESPADLRSCPSKGRFARLEVTLVRRGGERAPGLGKLVYAFTRP